MDTRDDLIWQYLDNQLNEPDRKAFETEVEQSPALKQELNHCRRLHAALKVNLEQPSAKFTAQVMTRIKNPGISVSRSLLLLGVILGVTAIAAVLLSMGAFDGTAHFTLSEFLSNKKLLPDRNLIPTVPQFDVSGRWIITVIIMLNSILALLIVDRGILRPWFDRRRIHAGY